MVVGNLDPVVHEQVALELIVVTAQALWDIQLCLVHVRPQVLKSAHVPKLQFGDRRWIEIVQLMDQVHH
jgi:RNAse (barnase) inhibitor barstar